MLSPAAIVAAHLKRDPVATRRIMQDVATLEKSPVYRRVKAWVDAVLDREGLSFALLEGATQIDPCYAALREGTKVPLALLEALGRGGAAIHERSDDGDGYTATPTP